MKGSGTDLFPPTKLTVVEVGPRDGFQMEQRLLPTELKIEVIDLLSRSGLADIEATSFVHPRVIPQMHDAEAVLSGVSRRPGVRYWALVPNLRGAERALDAGVDGVHVVIAASETYNQRNVGMSVEASLAGLSDIVELASDRVPVAATLAVAFGCPFEGQLPDARLVELSQRIVGAGARQLGLADTSGLGQPVMVRRIVGAVGSSLRASTGKVPIRMHLHDTRGLGMANAIAAMQQGVEVFDTSLGGLGGCPVMRGASGNLATEDLVNLCDEVGIETGVSLEVVRTASLQVSEFLQRELPGKLLQAGTREELYRNNRAP